MLDRLLIYISVLEGDTALMYLQRASMYWYMPVGCHDIPLLSIGHRVSSFGRMGQHCHLKFENYGVLKGSL
jgi:hypothetical protein